MSARNSTVRNQHRRAVARTQPPCAICGLAIDYTLTVLPNEHGAKCKKPDCQGCTPHPMRFELDHIIPLDKGGTDTLPNKQPSHRRCNSKKRARIIAPIVKRNTFR